MSIAEQFYAYAGDFEKTYRDDDWSRLNPYFAEDAVYEVDGAAIGCRIEGRDAIFRGIKKSLDGFDRKFDRRDIEVLDGPDVDGDELRLSWAVTYEKEGWTPYVLRGRSMARYRDGKLVHLRDEYDPSIADEMVAWQRDNGVVLDVSYV
jgi:hypothetical protein